MVQYDNSVKMYILIKRNGKKEHNMIRKNISNNDVLVNYVEVTEYNSLFATTFSLV